MSIRGFSFRRGKRDSKGASETSVVRTASSESDRIGGASAGVDDRDGANGKGPLGLTLLYAPSDPRFDFVFVHGLGGGSRKTWSKTGAASHYWPREWIPKDPAFKDVRVHSFGYDSDYVKGNDSCLNIHHIGRSLLGELTTSPHLGDSNTALVLIGHSMGGLVVKKAYLLARQENASLAGRVRAIYFLGTPHRGSNSAKVLKNILQVASSVPAFVVDLMRGSGALQSINDEFRQYSADLELWSFYETQKLRAGGLSILIVEPESATLGYREERQMPLNADHRSMCKFENASDQNYIIIWNALASTINNIASTDSTAQVLAHRDTIQSLASYLDVAGQEEEDDLHAVQDARADGTCEWILKKESYIEWKDHQHPTVPAVLWMSGKPSAGKSVLTGFVIDDIKQSDTPCSYYFFKHGDVSKARLSACLRSLAFQMASVDPGIRGVLTKLQEDRWRVNYDNERSLWRALFSPDVLGKATLPHYWVIDALDECSNFAPLLDSMLSKLDSSTQLRVFITSRETADLCRLFAGLGPHRLRQGHVSAEETLPDIERIVTANGGSLCTDSEESRVVLEQSIVEKSKGSFLWTRLVLDELSAAFSEEEIKRVLGEVPRGMVPLYHRVLDTMALATRGKTLAKAILLWTTCVMRPLTLRELECALEIDLQDKFPRLGDAIRTLCGQLVTVDATGRVQMVHETAREFLLEEGLDSEFAVRETEAHTRIAKTCLEFLSGEELRPPRTEKRQGSLGTVTARPSRRSEFLAYSNAMFSAHLSKADPSAEHVLGLVNRFLKLNVLTWIKNIAETGNLGPVIRAAEDLKAYANACAAGASPLGQNIQSVQSWSVDLQRVAAKFADALIFAPSVIYSRIAPFCPTDSAIHGTATTSPGQRLSVAGLSVSQWGDQLSCLDFGEDQPTALCYGNDFLAVGLVRGRVALYYLSSAQEYRSLDHGEMVMHLVFQEQSDLLASAGDKKIHIWNVRTGQQVHRLPSPRGCNALAFYDGLLVVSSDEGVLHSWHLDVSAVEQTKRLWRGVVDEDSPFLRYPPKALSISVAHRMMAVAYDRQPIMIWDLAQDVYYGSCGKNLPSSDSHNPSVMSLVFNPNVAIQLLAASYLDGSFIIIDPLVDRVVQSRNGFYYRHLTASPDGRLLAGFGGGHIIQIFEFDTLKLLYTLDNSNWVTALAFSPDGLSLAGLGGYRYCNIWMLPVLLAGASLDNAPSVNTTSNAGEYLPTGDKFNITALTLAPDRHAILCGKEDGSVSVYDEITGHQIQTLYCHKEYVNTLYWLPDTNTVLSTCARNIIVAWTLETSPPRGYLQWTAPLLAAEEWLKITHLLPGEGVGKFIVSICQSDHLWSLGDGKEECVRNDPGDEAFSSRRWVQHPRSQSCAIRVEGDGLHIHRWHDLSLVVSVSLREYCMPYGLHSKRAFPCGTLAAILLDLTASKGSRGTSAVFMLGCDAFPSEEEESTLVTKLLPSGDGGKITPTPTTSTTMDFTDPAIPKELCLTRLGSNIVGGQIADVIAVCAFADKTTKLVFLDTRSWVSSIDLVQNGAAVDLGGITSYTRHFFVPQDWFAESPHWYAWHRPRALGEVTEQGDVIFAKDGDVAIIKRGLESGEIVDMSSPTPLEAGK